MENAKIKDVIWGLAWLKTIGEPWHFFPNAGLSSSDFAQTGAKDGFVYVKLWLIS